MTRSGSETPGAPKEGGLARFCVEHREVAWAALIAVLVWGWFAYRSLAQQEDPTIPIRTAQLVTTFPGGNAANVELLVTKKLEQKINEYESVEEIKSESRQDLSIITIKLRPGSKPYINQEWDKLRAAIAEVKLPEGSNAPFLNTNFGNTTTLLFAITSPPEDDAVNIARANLLRSRIAQLRGSDSSQGHVAAAAFFPSSVPESYQAMITQRFVSFLERENVSRHVQTIRGNSFVMADFVTSATREKAADVLDRFVQSLAGTEMERHPDFPVPLLLFGDEDPLPQLRAFCQPRYSYRELELAADELRDELKQLPAVGRVQEIGIVDEAVHLLFTLRQIAGYGLDADTIAKVIAARNAIVPSGTYNTGGHGFPVQVSGEFRTERELGGTVIGSAPDGRPVYLRDLFTVVRGYTNPVTFNVDVLQREASAKPGSNDAAASAPDVRRKRAVVVSVEMKEGEIISHFAKQVHETVNRVAALQPEGVQVLTISNQPVAVEQRIHHFVRAFIEAVVIVVIVALFLMNWRSALVVATAIPLTISLTLGGMQILGVPLHQISIAALIIALGMLVDDPVVASDAIDREIAHGHPRGKAAWLGPHRLRHAILFGTVINIFAFLPLLLLPGDTGAFVQSLPIVVTLALAASRMVSVSFIPLLGYYLLRGQRGLEHGGELRRFPLFYAIDWLLRSVVLPAYRLLLRSALRFPVVVPIVAFSLLGGSFFLTRYFGSQFFPPAERNQFVVDVELGQSASIAQTRRVSDDVARIIRRHGEVQTAAVFEGGTAPRFYYNVQPRPSAPNLGQVIVNVRSQEEVPALVAGLQEELKRGVAGARCTVRRLEQGPPVGAPIQIRFRGADLDVLRDLSLKAQAALREAGGYNVYDDLGPRLPTLKVDVDQERANTLGVTNQQIGRMVQAAFRGLTVTQLREGDHLVPVSLRLDPSERYRADQIRTLYIQSLNKESVPLSSFASIAVEPEFATVAHYNMMRTATVSSYAPENVLPSAVLAKARPAIERIALPAGYQVEFAGESKEMAQSQKDMGRVIMVSLALITLSLIVQFSSVMKASVVVLTVPLGLIGAFVGMTVMHASFGFMALLGVVSLAGVIVSHIIVLSDFVEEARLEGMPVREALMQAGLVRLRPVLVTVLATVGGLIPLAVTGGELWRPLTAVHIFGLLFATALTLLVLPALYYLFHRVGLIK